MVYKWKSRGSYIPVPAQQVGEYLEQIEREEGAINPAILVDKSRDQQSPTHECFEWNDSIAAEEYRVVQAREVMRFIVTVAEAEEEPREVRAFYSVADKTEPSQTFYISRDKALADEEYREYILNQARNELESFRRKYEHLAELAGVVREIRLLSEAVNA